MLLPVVGPASKSAPAQAADSSGGTTLLVASTGGHLVELHQLAPRFLAEGHPYLWVTHDDEQSRSLLNDEPHVFVPRVPTRDHVAVLRTYPHAWRLLRDYDVNRVVSTGAAVALGFMPLAAAMRIPCHYIESAARINDIAMTGRLLMRVPGVRCYHQFGVHSPRWRPVGSVFDGFRSEQVERRPIQRVVVTVGTRVGFRRLLERLVQIIPSYLDVVWQTGASDLSGLGIEGRPFMAAAELDSAIAAADVVVAHCGVGTALSSYKSGRCPVLVPRKSEHAEAVDDHQEELAKILDDAGLAVAAGVDDLSWEHLVEASRRRVVQLPPARFQLSEARR